MGKAKQNKTKTLTVHQTKNPSIANDEPIKQLGYLKSYSQPKKCDSNLLAGSGPGNT